MPRKLLQGAQPLVDFFQRRVFRKVVCDEKVTLLRLVFAAKSKQIKTALLKL